MPWRSSSLLLMIYRIAADLVVLVHFAFVLFVALGGILVIRWRGLAWIHLPVAIYGVVIEFVGFYCPLTPLENWLRRKGGENGYEGGFVEEYLLKALYPDGLTHGARIFLGVAVLVINVVVYAFAAKRR